jgi:hypothetical protein
MMHCRSYVPLITREILLRVYLNFLPDFRALHQVDRALVTPTRHISLPVTWEQVYGAFVIQNMSITKRPKLFLLSIIYQYRDRDVCHVIQFFIHSNIPLSFPTQWLR